MTGGFAPEGRVLGGDGAMGIHDDDRTAGPRQPVADVGGAEEAGDGCSVISDHYAPWLEEQGHSPYAGAVPGTAAQATGRIPSDDGGRGAAGSPVVRRGRRDRGRAGRVSGCEQS